MTPFIGEVKMFAFGYAPARYAQCLGQIMAISQNAALYSVLGTYYGGDGKVTFGLPNLAGNCVVGQGQCTTGHQWYLGQLDGSPTVALDSTQMPAHVHGLAVTGAVGTQDKPDGNQLGRGFKGDLQQASKALIYTSQQANTQLDPSSMGAAGKGQPHENMMPYLAINYAIALQGDYPNRP